MILLQIEWTKAQAVAAFITGAVSIIIAIWTYVSGRLNQKETLKNQKEIETIKNDLSKENERLKHELAEIKSENDARREYEFEARKRLYQEYEPLLFQLMEAAENAFHRIQGLARTARHGNLNDIGWLSQFNYYTKSTIYKLFAPIALYQIMQKKLTLVDITVDKSIGLRYKIAKQIYLSYTDDFEFARTFESIHYDPNDLEWKVKRKDNPVSFWRQGLPMGLLDKTVDILIGKTESGQERLISYGEFEKKLADFENEEKSDIHLSRDIFLKFHPETRPVLWRILIAQSLLFRALIELKNIKTEDINEDIVRKLIINYDSESLSAFNWSNDKSSNNNFEEPYKVAVKYFEKRF